MASQSSEGRKMKDTGSFPVSNESRGRQKVRRVKEPRHSRRSFNYNRLEGGNVQWRKVSRSKDKQSGSHSIPTNPVISTPATIKCSINSLNEESEKAKDSLSTCGPEVAHSDLTHSINEHILERNMLDDNLNERSEDLNTFSDLISNSSNDHCNDYSPMKGFPVCSYKDNSMWEPTKEEYFKTINKELDSPLNAESMSMGRGSEGGEQPLIEQGQLVLSQRGRNLEPRSISYEEKEEVLACTPLAMVEPGDKWVEAEDILLLEDCGRDQVKISTWVVNRMKSLKRFLGISSDGFEDQFLELLLAVEEKRGREKKALTRNHSRSKKKGVRELKNLQSSISYDKGGKKDDAAEGEEQENRLSF